MAKRPREIKGHVLFEIFTKAIYTTFTHAIKEAVSNAYDAGANNVVVTFDPPTFLSDCPIR
jgi:DNA mismatch repair ATPase MutL